MQDPALDSLVARACRGDAAAFTRLVERSERMVLAVALAITGDGHLAGDVAQDTFLRAWQRLAELQQPQAFDAWVCGIARNLAADHRRRKPVVSLVNESLPADQSGAPDARIRVGERNAGVAAALAKLDETTRMIVVLRYYENRSSKQIGKLLSISAAAVDMRLSRARQQLRQDLSQWANQAVGADREVS